ncbi:MAG: hypothetical protein ACYS99_22360, partial [Planctomycetota bacterium]
RSGSTLSYIAGYDVEVAEAARIADPIVGQSFEGLAANVVPRLSADRGHVEIELWLLLAQRSLDKPVATGAAFIGVRDQLEERRTVLAESVRLPSNGVYTIDAGPDETAPGRRVAIEIKASVE